MQGERYQADVSQYTSHSSAPQASFSAPSTQSAPHSSASAPILEEEGENESSDDDIEMMLQARRQSEIAASNQNIGSGNAGNTATGNNGADRDGGEDDKDSVNSEDSDAWMNEA